MKEIKVLIVDDVSFMRQLIKSCLTMTSRQFVTQEVGSGKSAIESLEKEHFDIILCDWELPDIKGDEVLTWLRTESNFKKMPFIMITVNDSKEYIVQAHKLGVTDYMIKPVNCDTLARKVLDALKTSHNIQISVNKEEKP